MAFRCYFSSHFQHILCTVCRYSQLVYVYLYPSPNSKIYLVALAQREERGRVAPASIHEYETRRKLKKHLQQTVTSFTSEMLKNIKYIYGRELVNSNKYQHTYATQKRSSYLI